MIQPEDKATLPLALDEQQPRKRGRPAMAGAMTKLHESRPGLMYPSKAAVAADAATIT
ncbi:hypothetical protein [Robbsia andropogonis]|uniref:hypothetical protein n=1 Tax=Robbsia andropogonis TaxID=28092 RepID=UPI00158AA241|nr:hypothetical protein [Robbsia andropogonis]